MEQLVSISNKFNSLTVNLKEFIYKVMQILHADDSSRSVDDVEDAYSFYKRAKSIWRSTIRYSQMGNKWYQIKEIKFKWTNV